MQQNPGGTAGGSDRSAGRADGRASDRDGSGPEGAEQTTWVGVIGPD